LLTTTTSLIDPTKIRQVAVIISPSGQIQNISEQVATLSFANGQVINDIENIARISYGSSQLFAIYSFENTEALTSRDQDENALLYIPEQTDSIISRNEIKNKKLWINDNRAIDFIAGTMDTDITIQANGTTDNGLTLYDVSQNKKKVGILALYKKTQTITPNTIALTDTIKYAMENVFTQ